MSGTDYELLTKWRDGDRFAGDHLLRRHFPTVYRFFFNKAPDHVDDLCQRTFLGCVEALDRFDEGRQFRPYLLGIARNQLLMFLRSRVRDATLDIESAPIHVLSKSVSPLLVAREEQRVLLEALRRLPLSTQTTLELHYWEGMSTPEISTVLGLAVGSVRSRLSRAREALREQVDALDVSARIKRSTLDDLERWASSVRAAMDAAADSVDPAV